MDEPIVHDADRDCFEVVVDGHPCRLDYTRSADTLSLNSVQVPKDVGGRGIAGHLTRHALDWAREQGLQVNPRCPYVAAWIQRHPDYADLVA